MRISLPRFARPGSQTGFGRQAVAGGLLLALATAAAATAAVPAAAAPVSATSSAQQANGANGAAAGAGKPSKITWSILPATATGPDKVRTVFNYGTVKPGSTVLDHVEIVNVGKGSAAFSVYGTDATGTGQNDALLLLSPQKKPTDIGSWVHFPGGAQQLSTIIPAGKAIIEPFTVSIPRQATPGDHTGGLVAAVSITQANSAGIGVTENFRIAVPLELRVPGALHSGLQVQSVSTGFSDPLNPVGTGSATISYTVKNSGNVRLNGTSAVTVTALFGQGTVKPPPLPTILPGDSIRVTVQVPGLFAAGPMNAKISVTGGWPARTQPLKTSLPVAFSNASLFAVPWSLLGLVLLLVAIGVGIWFYFRWRRRLHRAELAAVAARARRDTERRLLGKKAAANGHGGSTEPEAGKASAEASAASPDPAEAPPDLAEVSSNPAEATASGGTQDGGGAATESTTE